VLEAQLELQFQVSKDNPTGLEMVVRFIVETYAGFHLTGSNFNTILSKTLESSIGDIGLLKSIRSIMTTWYERDLSIALNGTEYEFMKCNKTILVDTTMELKRTFANLSRIVHSNKGANYRLYMGNERILKQYSAIAFSGKKWDNGLLNGRFGRLLSSGIYHKFKEMESESIMRYYYLKDSKSYQPNPLNLNTNIVTLFVIYGACIMISILRLVMEFISEMCSTSNREKLKFIIFRWLYNTQNKLKDILRLWYFLQTFQQFCKRVRKFELPK